MIRSLLARAAGLLAAGCGAGMAATLASASDVADTVHDRIRRA